MRDACDVGQVKMPSESFFRKGHFIFATGFTPVVYGLLHHQSLSLKS